jgi:hypothetical protein
VLMSSLTNDLIISWNWDEDIAPTLLVLAGSRLFSHVKTSLLKESISHVICEENSRATGVTAITFSSI